MLKIVKTSLFIALTTAGFSMPVHADVNDDLANICTIVQADDTGELRKKLRLVQTDYRLKLQDIYPGITCDGNSLIRTAVINDSVEAGSLLIKKMPKSDLGAPEQDGKTLIAWISENGHDSSPIASALQKRM